MCSRLIIYQPFFCKINPAVRSKLRGVKETSPTVLNTFEKCQIAEDKFLVYNFGMKKILSIFLIIFGLFGVCSADELGDRIKILYAENNIKEAFNLLLSIPEEERTSEQWLMMGNILEDEGQMDEVAFMYNSAISADNKNYKAHYNLGNVYMSQNKPNMAIAEYKKATKYKPEFAYGYYNLGCAYLKIGKPRAAKYEFFKAIDINNQVADFHYNLAYTFKLLKNEKQAKIYLDYYNKLVERGL